MTFQRKMFGSYFEFPIAGALASFASFQLININPFFLFYYPGIYYSYCLVFVFSRYFGRFYKINSILFVFFGSVVYYLIGFAAMFTNAVFPNANPSLIHITSFAIASSILCLIGGLLLLIVIIKLLSRELDLSNVGKKFLTVSFLSGFTMAFFFFYSFIIIDPKRDNQFIGLILYYYGYTVPFWQFSTSLAFMTLTQNNRVSKNKPEISESSTIQIDEVS